LARQVYFGFTGLPSAIPHPYEDGADYYKAVPAIQAQLESPDRVQEMLNNLTGALDGMGESDRYYDSVAHAKKLLSEYADGTFSYQPPAWDGLRLQPVSELEQSVARHDMRSPKPYTMQPLRS
jgi:hypothetical protein